MTAEERLLPPAELLAVNTKDAKKLSSEQQQERTRLMRNEKNRRARESKKRKEHETDRALQKAAQRNKKQEAAVSKLETKVEQWLPFVRQHRFLTEEHRRMGLATT